jgi:sulfide:quinone oxidoreductase
MCDASGWIPVDCGTLETRFPRVYAIGDVTGILLASIGRPLPKAGVFAHKQAEVVAHNIAAAPCAVSAARASASSKPATAGRLSGGTISTPTPRPE